MLERVMIISGESSGELYGALLAESLISGNPGIRIIGVGGDRMESSGVDLVSRISSAFGLIEAVRMYGEIRKTFHRVISALESFRPQVLVLIDYPDFNMKVARSAKRLGIKILYYVSPQIWAWRRGRIRILATLVDMMAVILPFEEALYRQEMVPCEFVGHPVLDEIRGVLQESGLVIDDIGSEDLKAKTRRELGLKPDSPVMTLMPGSRHHEIDRLLPIMTDVIISMKQTHPDYQFLIPVAPNLDRKLISRLALLKGCRLLEGETVRCLLASNLAVIASGTSTLQAAFLKVPTVVVYKLSPLTYLIGKLIVKVDYISLVNILIDKSVRDGSGFHIKELLQGDVSTENIVQEIKRIIEDSKYRDELLKQYERIAYLFSDKKPSLRVAELVKDLAFSA